MVRIEQFKDYYLSRRIGIGGMAEIFRAWKIGEEGFEKQMVVKRLLTHLASNDDFRAMFLDEARLASQLNHPNIVHVYDLGKHADPHSGTPSYFIAMEYVSGKNLVEIRNKAMDKNLALSLDYLVRIIAGAAAALHYAHKKKDDSGRPLNLVHRDVSPRNILISYDGDVKLVDFGIAKALTKTQHTQAGVLKGKLAYMSPEQARGEDIDHRADIYALGVVFWEFLTGKRLFSGETEASVLRKVLDPKIEPPSHISSFISPELEALCMKCLASNREDRYPDALSLTMALEAHLRDLTTLPDSYSIRDFMRLLFGLEMESESLQIQEEIKAVRTLASTSMQPDATFVLDQDAKDTVMLPSGVSSSSSKPVKTDSIGLLAKIPGGLFSVVGAGLGLILLLLVLLLSGKNGSRQVDSVAPSLQKQDTLQVRGVSVGMVAVLQQIEDLLADGNVDAGLSRLEQEENGRPWSVSELNQIRASLLTRKAEARMDTDPATALTELQEVLTHFPNYPEAHLQIGRVFTRLNQTARALQGYEKAVDLNPALHVAHYNLGVLLFQTGEYEQAEQALLKSLELQPPYLADVLVNLAACRARAGDMENAKTYLRKAVETDPKHEIAKKNLERLTQ